MINNIKNFIDNDSLKKIFNWAIYLFSSYLFFRAFPKFNNYSFAWFALAPMLVMIISSDSFKKIFIKVLVVGLISYLAITNWAFLLFSVSKISVQVALLAWIKLALYLTICFTLWSYVAYKYRASYKKIWYVFLLCSLWVFFEFIRVRFLLGMPYGVLGYTQYKNLQIIQIAEFTSVYGVSFLLIFCNVVIATNLYYIISCRKILIPGILIFIIFFVGIYTYGNHILYNKEYELHSKYYKCAIIQGSIRQYMKNDKAYNDFVLNKYKKIVEEVAKPKDLIVLSETCLPGIYDKNIELKTWITDIIQTNPAYYIIGLKTRTDREKYYNSVLFFDRHGKELGRYNKIHLAPFTERLIYKSVVDRFFPSISYASGLSAGRERSLFPFHGTYIGTPICFEICFPNEIRKFVLGGANTLVNISNDAWFLNTAAPWNYFTAGIFRAVENRRYVIRSANSGITAVINEKGRVLRFSNITDETILNGTFKPLAYKSFYTLYGDVFAFLCTFFLVIFFGIRWFFLRR